MNEQVKIFKAKLDYYYKLLVIYFVFLVIYSLMRGTFLAKEFTLVFHDPIIYITLFFILYTIAAFLVSLVKSKESYCYFSVRFSWSVPSREETVRARFDSC